MEEHLDTLLELVSSHYWRAVKHEIHAMETGLTAQLLTPSTSLIELVAKEGQSSRLAGLRQLVTTIEEKADQHARRVRTR